MSAIAQKCNVNYNTLLSANTSITHPDLIQPRQAVQIPATSSVPVTGAQASGQTYTVVSGDDLSSIAQWFNTSVQAILNTNTWISNQNLILPGWVIALPVGSSSGASIPTTGGQTYTVVAGDNLFGIAQRFNTTTAALMSANPWISNPNLILSGWVITIR